MSNSTMSNSMNQQSSPCPTYVHPIKSWIIQLNLASAATATVKPLEMGLSRPTSLLACSPCATSRAPTISTIILLRSLADLDGGFDIPKQKCPPDRGSSDWVTDSLASMLPPSPRSPFLPASTETTTNRMTTATFPSAVSPRRIPGKSLCDLPTPPLTPDDDDDKSGASGITSRHSKDALDLLLNIFPRDGLSLLSFAKSVVVSSQNMGASFDGVVLDLPGKPKTLYVDGKNAPAVNFRESVVALLDLADEQLQCSALVIVLDKSSSGLGKVLHSLMYVGGSVVTKPAFQINPAYILVGLEI
ncbi:ornithine decarboxylase antizyme-domain-containing protein [Scleroderma yunnanense]